MSPVRDPEQNMDPCRFCASQRPNRMRITPNQRYSICRACLEYGHPDYSIVKDYHPSNNEPRGHRHLHSYITKVGLERAAAREAEAS